MTKKLQQDSVWAKYDIDQDGTVSDEELERATQMLELDQPKHTPVSYTHLTLPTKRIV